MKILQHEETVTVSEIKELGATVAHSLPKKVRSAMPDSLKVLEFDLSDTEFIDSRGLGALISAYRTACSHNGLVTVRLINPTPPIQQILELTRLHRIFEIVKRPT